MGTILEQLINDWVKKREHVPSDGEPDPVTFLKKLVNRTRPTDAEIVEMAHALDIQEESLFSFCDRLTTETTGEPDHDV